MFLCDSYKRSICHIYSRSWVGINHKNRRANFVIVFIDLSSPWWDERVLIEIRRLRISFRRSLESSSSYGTETLPSSTGDRSSAGRRVHAALTAIGGSEEHASVVAVSSNEPAARSGTSRTVVPSLGRVSDFRGHQSLARLLRFGARPLDRLRSDRQRPDVPFVLNGSTVRTTTYSRIKLTCLATV